MNEITMYPKLYELTVKIDFKADYIEQVEESEDIIPICSFKRYKKGQKIYAIGKVKSNRCSSGYGYIIFDKEIEEALVIEINFI